MDFYRFISSLITRWIVKPITLENQPKTIFAHYSFLSGAKPTGIFPVW